MLQYFDPVPFTIENESHFGLSETQGLLSSDGENLLVEFRIADTIIGAIKTASTTLKVPIADIHSMAYEKKYFGLACAIRLRTRSQQALEGLPESKMGTIRMKVKRCDRDTAFSLCLGVQEAVVRHRGQMLRDGIARLEEGDTV
jgi:hypothetical protein